MFFPQQQGTSLSVHVLGLLSRSPWAFLRVQGLSLTCLVDLASFKAVNLLLLSPELVCSVLGFSVIAVMTAYVH